MTFSRSLPVVISRSSVPGSNDATAAHYFGSSPFLDGAFFLSPLLSSPNNPYIASSRSSISTPSLLKLKHRVFLYSSKSISLEKSGRSIYNPYSFSSRTGFAPFLPAAAAGGAYALADGFLDLGVPSSAYLVETTSVGTTSAASSSSCSRSDITLLSSSNNNVYPFT